VCEPQNAGGLGIINIKLFNVALLGKWIWRMGSSEDGLWKEVLESKYGGWRSLKVSNPYRYGSLWWKDLKKVWASKDWEDKFEDRVKWELGNGKSILFWEDVWVGNIALKGKFSETVFPEPEQ